VALAGRFVSHVDLTNAQPWSRSRGAVVGKPAVWEVYVAELAYQGSRLGALVATAAMILTVAATSTSAMVLPLAPPLPPYHVTRNEVLGVNDVRLVPQGFVIDCAAFDQPVDTLCKGRTLTGAAIGHIDETYLKLIDSIVNKASGLGLVTIPQDKAGREPHMEPVAKRWDVQRHHRPTC
jgi:hypothetical protein